MLKIDFINVGDGDAILLRCAEGNTARTILVDCGRPYVEFANGSKRGSCIDYLMRAGIDKIDLLVISHLHLDHMGGALRVLHHVPVTELLALYLPPAGARWISPQAREAKSIVGLCDTLNLWNEIITFAGRQGCACREAKSGQLSLGGLQLGVHLPDAALATRQKTLFDALYRGETPPEDAVAAVSKERNCSSLILRAEYTGRSLLLTGDCYASYWQDAGQKPCDILKIPHHGDSTSMNEPLLRSLHPEFAVISCQNDSDSKKDRPFEPILDLLLQNVPHVLCTENKALPRYPAATRDAVCFTVENAVIFHAQGHEKQ
jgi:hypothetical protein